jgi:hypothetical protein
MRTTLGKEQTLTRSLRIRRDEPCWRYHEIDASHSRNVTAPDALMELLEKIIAERA